MIGPFYTFCKAAFVLKGAFDLAASDHWSRISGGLGGKVIAICMDNDRFSYNFIYSKALVVKC